MIRIEYWYSKYVHKGFEMKFVLFISTIVIKTLNLILFYQCDGSSQIIIFLNLKWQYWSHLPVQSSRQRPYSSNVDSLCIIFIFLFTFLFLAKFISCVEGLLKSQMITDLVTFNMDSNAATQHGWLNNLPLYATLILFLFYHFNVFLKLINLN